MPGITYPNIFAALGGNQPGSLLDANFNAVPDGINSLPGALRLVGINDLVTPATKYGLTADLVYVRKLSTNAIIAVSSGVTLTVDLALAGPIANGRDQLAAFVDNSWVFIYYIWNGATLALIASATQPTSSLGPTLPIAYTHSMFAAALRFNAVQTLARIRINGNAARYEASNTVLTNGPATVETAVPISTAIPPNALSAIFTAELLNTHSLASVQATARIRIVTGVNYVNLQVQSQVAAIAIRNSGYFDTPNVGQQIFYLWSPAFDTVNALTLNVEGYQMPNGST